jgi:hypothetical protein
MARHIEQPGSRQSKPALMNILCKPSASACSFTRPEPGTPLAFMALIAIYKQSQSALLTLGTLAGFIQLLDAGVGLLQHDPGKSTGPLVIAAFQFFAVYRLSSFARSSAE